MPTEVKQWDEGIVAFDEGRLFPVYAPPDAQPELRLASTVEPNDAVVTVIRWIAQLASLPKSIRFIGHCRTDTAAAVRAKVHSLIVMARQGRTHSDLIDKNVAANLDRWRDASFVPNLATRMPVGRTAVVVGGGPSAIDSLDELETALDDNPMLDVHLLVVDRAMPWLFDRKLLLSRVVAGFTLEQRPEKMDAFRDWPAQYARTVVAGIASNPGRIPPGWVEMGYVLFTRWESEFPPIPATMMPVEDCPTVANYTTRVALKCFPRRVVLIGCDHALASDGAMYADPALPAHPMHNEMPKLETPAIGGGAVWTTEQMNMSISDMTLVAMRAKAMGVPIVNATLRGAFLPQWNHMSLVEALDG